MSWFHKLSLIFLYNLVISLLKMITLKPKTYDKTDG